MMIQLILAHHKSIMDIVLIITMVASCVELYVLKNVGSKGYEWIFQFPDYVIWFVYFLQMLIAILWAISRSIS